MTDKNDIDMQDVIWISDIEGSHCRCWGVEFCANERVTKAKKYIRADAGAEYGIGNLQINSNFPDDVMNKIGKVIAEWKGLEWTDVEGTIPSEGNSMPSSVQEALDALDLIEKRFSGYQNAKDAIRKALTKNGGA